MIVCEICEKKKPANSLFSYRRECADCRAARKRLQKHGASHKNIKIYLEAIGKRPPQAATRSSAPTDIRSAQAMGLRKLK